MGAPSEYTVPPLTPAFYPSISTLIDDAGLLAETARHFLQCHDYDRLGWESVQLAALRVLAYRESVGGAIGERTVTP